MTCYIAGPMTGYPEYNFPAFDRAKAYVEQALGLVAISPADHSRRVLTYHGLPLDGLPLDGLPLDDERRLPPKVREGLIRWDVAAVMDCDAICMLRGWEKSVGARAEHALAVWMGKHVILFEPDAP